MIKSDFGKETAYLWKGMLGNENISLKTIESTLNISPKEKEEMAKAFEEARQKNPSFFDGPLWRYEGHSDIRGGVEFLVSKTSYMVHNIRRHKDLPVDYINGRFISEHVNPFTINAIQVTSDNKILIGVKGKIADQRGLGVMGAGFLKRKEGLPPANLFYETLRECLEETKYDEKVKLTEGDVDDFRAFATIFGSNHDTTTAMYVPLKATSKQVDLGNQEHSDLLFLNTDDKSLAKFLNDGGMNGIKAVDPLIGCVELYREHNNKGILSHPYK